MNPKQIILIVTTISAFLAPFMTSSINVALPSIGREFALTSVELGWIASSYLLASAAFMLAFGKLADIYGRKRIYRAGMLVYTAGSALSAFPPSAPVFIAFRAIQGIGGAMILGTGVAILTSVYPGNQRGKVLGINIASTYSGLSFGPVLGGILTEQFGWRSIFWLNVFAGLVIFALILLFVKDEWKGAAGERFDAFGAVLSWMTLIPLMIGVSRLPKVDGTLLICVGFASLLGFIFWENRVAAPLLNLHLFAQNRVFALSNLAALINYSATFAVSFLLSLYLQYIKGFSPQQAGMTLIAQPVMMAIFSPICGRLSDRMSTRTLASSGMAMIVVALGLLALITAQTPIPFLVGVLVLLGIGFALFSSPNTNAVMGAVEPRFYGIASATLATMRSTGQTLSLGIATLVFALFLGNNKITPELHPPFLQSVQLLFLLFAALCVVGTFASLARGKQS
ncbi:putative transport protein [Candidatus Moduliflexus flocculans]|uniref:Putative transport protein n=1 Tax=Candidatus Moduliflexus flocculans TaxID=1499966 RepID=A0A0S6VQV3_9BACT|nr:putative transport protein [Candidatus Moduliflexus flocculans]